jgi:hypothetical protein
MKRIVFSALIALALPLAAFASSVDLGNDGGTLTGTSTSLSLNGSEFTQVTGFNGMGLTQGTFGSVSFTTGPLLSGNMIDGAVLGNGGTFTITSNGKDGLPKGVLFQGTFEAPNGQAAFWKPSGTIGVSASIFYTLSGSISGTWYNGLKVNGATTQITFDTGKNGFMGSVSLGSGNTVFTVTPEPSTLGLLGTGLVGLAGIVRKKLRA